MKTKISVVIPTYRRPALLINCLRALSRQDLPQHEFEIIVVSDGPDSKTYEALLPWIRMKQGQLKYLQTPEKTGPAAARNRGWMSAKSDLIAFTDDDCLPQPCWLSTITNQYKQMQSAVAFSGKTTVPLPVDPSDFAKNTANLQTAEFITANCACPKAQLIKIGGFDERYKLAWREDSDLQFTLLKHGIGILNLDEAKVIHPVRHAPWGQSIKEQKKGIYDALLYAKFPELYRSKIQPSPLWQYYLINLCWVFLLVSILNRTNLLIILSSSTLLVLIGSFVFKRLKRTNKQPGHVLEMCLTSLIIPSLAVYWRICGAIKYRVFFI